MKIKKIIKLKSGKYKLALDNNEFLITYDEVILNNNLLFNKEIDDSLYIKIKEENNYYDILNSAIKYITKRLRSEKEIRVYLEKKTKDFYMIDDIVNNLKDKKLIDDINFTKAYINDKINLSNTGINKIKNELENLGISSDIIENECSKVDLKKDYNKLEKMIIKKIKLNHKYSNKILKEKIIYEMTNLGYDYNAVISIYDSNIINNDDDIYKKEYQKLYNKLKKKYEGNELEFQINKKLYAKGFSIKIK